MKRTIEAAVKSKFIKDQDDEILLPGEKEFKTVSQKVAELDSTKSEINNALTLISKFYADQENEKRESESEHIHKFLLLEFSGLIIFTGVFFFNVLCITIISSLLIFLLTTLSL